MYRETSLYTYANIPNLEKDLKPKTLWSPAEGLIAYSDEQGRKPATQALLSPAHRKHSPKPSEATGCVPVCLLLCAR